MTRSRRRGFTLIELLVVIAIIALLVTILMPSLNRAKELTRAVVCLTNLSGIGRGAMIYQNMHDGHTLHTCRWPVELAVFGETGVGSFKCPSSEADLVPDIKGDLSIPLFGSLVYADEEAASPMPSYVCLDYKGRKLLTIHGGVSYGFSYESRIGSWYKKGENKRPRAEDLDGGMLMLAENNLTPYQKNSYVLVRDNLNGDCWGFNDTRHLGPASVLFLNGSTEQLTYEQLTHDMWYGS